jgi:hypothetical protein
VLAWRSPTGTQGQCAAANRRPLRFSKISCFHGALSLWTPRHATPRREESRPRILQHVAAFRNDARSSAKCPWLPWYGSGPRPTPSVPASSPWPAFKASTITKPHGFISAVAALLALEEPPRHAPPLATAARCVHFQVRGPDSCLQREARDSADPRTGLKCACSPCSALYPAAPSPLGLSCSLARPSSSSRATHNDVIAGVPGDARPSAGQRHKRTWPRSGGGPRGV